MTILKYYDETDGVWKPFVNNANDAVTLSGDQTIAGKKTFTEDVNVTGDIYSNGKKVQTRDRYSAAGVLDVSTTGNKTVSGLEFEPAYVEFQWGRTTHSTFYAAGWGMMTDSFQRAYGGQTGGSVSTADRSAGEYATNKCYIFISQSGSPVANASRVSINSDGFTISVDLASTALPEVIWKAHR